MAIILVTGANRGIGYAITKSIAGRMTDSTVLLGCRIASSGQEAIQQLEKEGVQGTFNTVEIDIENDASIQAAADSISQKYGRLDALVNNAVKLTLTKSEDLGTIRAASNASYNNAITSNAIVTKAMEPLLRKSADPRVVMVSSTRGSMGLTANKELPAVAVVDYCIAKAGLNMLTLHLQSAEEQREAGPRIAFWAVSPGHCKTGFNGFRGKKDPVDGAEVVIRLLQSPPGEIAGGTFWEFENGKFQMPSW